MLILEETGQISNRPAVDPLVDDLRRTGAGAVRVCPTATTRLADRVDSLRRAAPQPVAIHLRPSCPSKHRTSRRSVTFPAGWERAVAATRDSDLAERLGLLFGRLSVHTGADAVLTPDWIAGRQGERPPVAPSDSLTSLANRLTEAFTAGLSEARTEAVHDTPHEPTRAVAFGGAIRPENRESRSIRTVPIAGTDSLPPASVRAVERGADRIVIPADDRTVRRALVQAAREGRISEDRLRSSAVRVLVDNHRVGRLRARRRVPFPDSVRPASALDRSRRLIQDEIARRSVTLLVNRGDLLPLSPVEPTSILHVHLSGPASATDPAGLNDRLDRSSGRATFTHRSAGPDAGGDHFRSLNRAADEHDLVVVTVPATTDSGVPLLSDRQRDWADNLNREGPPLVVLGLGSERIARIVDRPEALLLTYTAGPSAERAAGQALFGRSAIGGRIPTAVSAAYPSGRGLSVSQQTLRTGPPESVGMNARVLHRIDRVIRTAIADSAFPGAALAVGRSGTLVKLKGYGHFSYESIRPVGPESAFDLASLTKVVATTPAVMDLYESDRISLDAPVTEYWPEFGQNGKERVTVRHLLTHTSGLRPFHHPVHLVPGNPFFALPLPYTPFYRLEMLDRTDLYGFIARDTLQYTPGTEHQYSDLGMITMAHLVERITDRSLGAFLEDRVFGPLGMRNTEFRSTGPASIDPSVVPTEHDFSFRLRVMQGEVHDEAAYIMGGTSGHAGLFSTARDLARYADMLTRRGRFAGRTIFRSQTIDLFTRPVSPERHTRALGWDTRSSNGYSSAGDLFGPESFGHTGFTGTSVWIDPERDLYVVLLTNRVHPNRFNRGHIDVRPKVADIAYRATHGPPVTLVPGSD